LIRMVHGRPVECVRTRANLYGRRGPGNRCGHDRKHHIRPFYKRTLPDPIVKLARRVQAIDMPLLLGRYARRSECVEAVRAVLIVMVGRLDLLTWRVGRPDRKRRGKFNGLSVDYDLAPESEISESRVERAIGTMMDWGWIAWTACKPGGRKARRGFLRCSAQPIEKTSAGERRGRAAIRCFTEDFFRFFGMLTELRTVAAKRHADAKKQADVVNVPIAPLVAELAELVDHLAPGVRPRPPP